MTRPRFRSSTGALVALAVLLVAGCTSTGTTGDSTPARNSRGGGWENFRAEVPIPERAPATVS